MATAKPRKTRYLRKEWDARDDYRVGEEIVLKWHRRWKIVSVTYNSEGNYTSIKLSKM